MQNRSARNMVSVPCPLLLSCSLLLTCFYHPVADEPDHTSCKPACSGQKMLHNLADEFKTPGVNSGQEVQKTMHSASVVKSMPVYDNRQSLE